MMPSRRSCPSLRPQRGRIAAVLAIALLLVACGKSGSPGNQPAAAAAPASTERAGDGLPEVDCPAKIGSKVDGPDIAGLKLGLTRDEALNLARCAQKNAVVVNEDRFFSELNTGAMKLGPQQFTVQSGETAECKYKSMVDMQACGLGNRVWKHVDETVTVATPGVPGRETAVGIWRTQYYRPGEQPAADSVQQALIAKYGAPQRTQKNDGGNRPWVQIWWLSDPSGQPISAQNPLATRCPTINARGDVHQGWSEACGMTVAAMINLAPDNPLLVNELSVGMADQARLYAYGTAMQEEILALEQQRQQNELKAAQQGAAAPKL